MKLLITADSQIGLPADILEHLGVPTGGLISVELLPHRRVELRAAPADGISAAFDLLKKEDGAPPSIEQIDEIARKGWSGEADNEKDD